MKPIKKIFSIFAILALMVFMTSVASAQVDSVNLAIEDTTVDASVNSTVSVDVTVDNPSQIAGAAFTVLYDAEDLTLTSVTSTFFDTFANQGITPTSVTVGDETYTQPLVTNDITETGTMMMGGTMIAAARVQAGATNPALFTLTFDLANAFNGTYPILIVPSVINNPDAGWNGEASPMLVGALDPSTPPESAFPEIPVNMPPDDPIAGFITVVGSTNFDYVTLDINQPFNVDMEQYVEIAAGGEWHVWFHTDTNIIELNGFTIKLESITSFAGWAAGTLPNHTGITATTWQVTPDDIGKIFSIKITDDMYALIKVTGFTANEKLDFEFMPLGNWGWGEGPGGEGCGGEFSISGTITDGANPIPGVWIEVFSDTVWCGSRVMTNENGVYTATGLIAGDYTVAYWPPPPEMVQPDQTVYQEAYYCSTCGNTTTRMWDEATPVTVDSDTTDETNISMVLSTGASISGVINDESDVPITFPVWVDAWSESTGSWGGVVSSDGTYTITGLAGADDYRVTMMPHLDWETGELLSPDFMPVLYTSAGGTTNWDNAEPVTAPAADINFTYKEGASISGRVTSDGYHGISGIWVSAWSEAAMIGNGAMTDADGKYIIKGLDDTATYTVDVYDPNYAYQFIENVATGRTDVNFTLSPGASITGTVKDDAANPISGVWVEAWSPSTGAWGGGMSGENSDFTFNTTGTYTISGLPPANDYIVTVWPYNYASQEYSTAVNLTQGDVTEIDFVLSAGKYIAGTVTDANGPVAGVWIDAYSESTWGWGGAITEANGTYKITGLPDAADYVVSYWPDPGVQYKQAFYNEATTWETATRVNITGGSQDGIDLVLSAGVSISGTVTRGANPVSGIWVDAWSSSKGAYGGANTNNDGTYSIDGLAAAGGVDDYIVTVYPFNKAPVEQMGVSAPASSIDFNLATAIGKVIKGTVTDGTDPVQNAWVNVWSASTGSWGSAQTNDLGEFEISGLAEADDFEVNVWSPDFGNKVVSGISSGYGSVSIDPIVFSAGVTISGAISGLTESGWNLWVDAWSETTGSSGGTEASFDSGTGTYTYIIKGLDSAVIDYRVSVNGFNPSTCANIMTIFYTADGGTTMWDSAALVDVSDEIPDDNINFTVEMGKSIEGTVSIDGVTAPNPQLEGIWVDAWSEAFCSWGGGMTDDTGAYTITGLASASDYRVSVWKEGYPSVFYNETASTVVWDNATLIDVTAGDVENIDITLSKGGSITGTVTNTSGQAMADVWVDVYSSSQQFGMGAFTDIQGKYNVSGLMKGVLDYEVSVWPMGDYKHATKKGKKVGDVVNFTLSEGFTFYGKLTTDGSALYTGGAWVNIWNDEFYGWAEVFSGNSVFSIEGLSEGDYEIIIWPNEAGYVQIEQPLPDLTSASSSSGSPMDFTFGAGQSISGTVKDSSENGIPGTFVDAWSSAANGWGSAITGSDGTYTITGLPAGSDYIVSVWSPIYPGAEKTGISAGTENVDFTLSTGGSITGTVRYNGAPREDVWVEAYSESNQSWAGAYTGSDGTYTLSGLREKTTGGVTITDYVVTVYPEELAIQSKSGKKVGDTVNFDLSSGDSISGTILDNSADDSSLEGVKVKIFNAGDSNNGLWLNNVFTDENGVFEIKGIPAGNYNIKAQMDGYDSAWYDADGTNGVASGRVNAEVVPSGTTDITFKLTAP